jgi:hypothetical protein
MVITRKTAEQIAARFAVQPRRVQRWWNRLLRHEVRFHLGEHPEHAGPRHDAHAARIAAAWRDWTATETTSRWVLVVGVGVGLGIPSIVLGLGFPLPAVAALVMFVLWGAFDVFEENGWSKRVVAPVVALIWMTDLWIDLGSMLAVAGFGVWVAGAFVLADLAFLIATWPAAVRAWRGRGEPAAAEGWVKRWVALPAVTTAIGMHTIELVLAASWAAVPMGVAAVALVLLTVIEHVQVRRKGAGHRVKRGSVYVEGAALIGYALLRAAAENLWWLAGPPAFVALALTPLLWVLHQPLDEADVDERRPRPLRWVLSLGLVARSAVRRVVIDRRNRGPPQDERPEFPSDSSGGAP